MSIFSISRINLSFQRQSSTFLSKSDIRRIKNGGTKIDPPPNLKLAIKSNYTSKYNQNQTPRKLKNARKELEDPSISKISLETIYMRYFAIIL